MNKSDCLVMAEMIREAYFEGFEDNAGLNDFAISEKTWEDSTSKKDYDSLIKEANYGKT